MDLKEIRYILAIAKYKNISYASKALYITQPSLTKYLQNLEHNLNGKLFNRIGNEYVPTYLGERYIHYVTQINEVKEQWEKEYLDIMELNNGRLTIAIPLMRSSCIIPDTLTTFKKNYPNVKVNIKEDIHSIEENVYLSNEIDFAIFCSDTFHADFEYITLGKEEIVLILSQNHPLAKTGISKEGCHYPWIDLKKFADDSFVLLFPDQNTGKAALQLFSQADIKPDILLHTRNNEVAIQLANKNMAVTFAPESYLKQMAYSLDSPVCFSVGMPNTEIVLMAAYRKGKYLSKYALEYLDIIKKYLSTDKQDL
ncbi:MAG: LysR family transcriptional regulator [Anaerocolumna sp.]